MVTSKHIHFGLIIISALFFSVASSFANAVSFTASLDRQTISEGDVVSLTLKYGEQVSFGSPDLSVLETQWEVLGTNRSSQFRSVNGRAESWTEWNISLSPKKTGRLTIPGIEFKGERTTPKFVLVKKLSKKLRDQRAKEAFFDVKVSPKNTFVQSQILYRERIYFSVKLDDTQLTDLEIADAVVQQLGETNVFETTIDGKQFGVIERVYAIFPQQSGELVIPGQRLNAAVINRQNFWSPSRPLRLSSDPIKLNVKPKPQNYPAAPWLPASKLKVDEQWSVKGNEVALGEPITRKLITRAHGLSGAQLPAIPLPEVAGIKYYPDQSDSTESVDTEGLIATRTDTLAIVPTQEGEILLPEIKVPWFDTKYQQVRYAVIPPKLLNVVDKGGVSKKAPETAQPADQEVLAASPEHIANGVHWLWKLLTALFFFTTVLFAWLYWQIRKQEPKEHLIEESVENLSEKQRFKQLQSDCRNHNPKQARESLIKWAQAFWMDSEIQNLKVIMVKASDQSLNLALQELDSLLYSPFENDAWNGNRLIEAVSELRKQPETKADQPQLRSLYPN